MFHTLGVSTTDSGSLGLVTIQSKVLKGLEHAAFEQESTIYSMRLVLGHKTGLSDRLFAANRAVKSVIHDCIEHEVDSVAILEMADERMEAILTYCLRYVVDKDSFFVDGQRPRVSVITRSRVKTLVGECGTIETLPLPVANQIAQTAKRRVDGQSDLAEAYWSARAFLSR